MQTPGQPQLSRSHRLANFFGLKRNLVILLIAIFVIGAGEELWMRFVPKYLQAVGAAVFVIGLYDALRTLLGAIYAYPGGVLVDRWGHRRVFIIFNLVSIVGYALVLLAPHWAAVIAGMFLFPSSTCFSSPATFSMDYIGVSGEQVGVLTAIEMLAATLCIIPASHYADRHGREPFVIATFIMFTLFPISLLMSRSFPALVVAFVIRGLKEFGDTSRKALIIGYSDSNRRGQMVGAYYLVRDLIVSTGAILGAYLWKVGPGLNFLGAAALGATGTIFYVKTIRQSRQAALNDLKKQLEMRRTRWK